MNEFTVNIESRDDARPVRLDGLELTPGPYTWNEKGGPRRAVVEAGGDIQDLWGLLQLLRCPIEILDAKAEPRWWGYIHEIVINDGIFADGVSMTEMYTRIAVAYNLATPGVAAFGERQTTSYTQDDDNLAEYGKREILLSAGAATAAEAENLRDVELAKRKEPIPIPRVRTGSLRTFALLKCRGWYDTLGWTYYTRSAGLEQNAISDATQAIGGPATTIEEHTDASGNQDIGGPAETIEEHTDTSGTNNLGDVAANNKIETSFTIPNNWTVTQAQVRIKTVGSPADNVTVKLYDDSAGDPGTLLATATLAAASIGDSLTWVEFAFAASVNLTASTTYHLEIDRSGANDATNYYNVSVDEGLGYVNGALQLWDGASWGTRSPNADLPFRIQGVVEKLETSFTIPNNWTVTQAQIRIKKVGSPVDNVTVKLYDNSSGDPGTLLATATVSGSNISESSAWVEFAFAAPTNLTGSTTYHLEIDRSGANDATNYYNVSVDEGLGYANGSGQVYTGTDWITRPTDADVPFRIQGVYTKIEQSFQLTGGEAWAASNAQIKVRAEGSPGDNLQIKLYSDSSGDPGSLLATGTASTVPTSTSWIVVDLDTEVSLSLATTYHIEVSRTGANDADNYYVVSIDETLSYASGAMQLYTGTDWLTRSTDADMAFKVGGVEETTQQIKTAVENDGEFVTTVDIEDASSIKTSQYRDGDRRLVNIINELLDKGVSGGRRLLATITRDRKLRVYQEPTANEYRMDRNGLMTGILTDPIDLERCPVAAWVARADVPGISNSTTLLDASRFFIQESRFDPRDGSYKPTPRDVTPPLRIRGIRQG